MCLRRSFDKVSCAQWAWVQLILSLVNSDICRGLQKEIEGICMFSSFHFRRKCPSLFVQMSRLFWCIRMSVQFQNNPIFQLLSNVNRTFPIHRHNNSSHSINSLNFRFSSLFAILSSISSLAHGSYIKRFI